MFIKQTPTVVFTDAEIAAITLLRSTCQAVCNNISISCSKCPFHVVNNNDTYCLCNYIDNMHDIMIKSKEA